MKQIKNYPSPKWQEICPDCKKKNLLIWKHGKIHCGNCLAGGNFKAEKYEFIKKKYFE